MQRPVPFALLGVAITIAMSATACKRHEPTDASQPASATATVPGAQTPPPEATQPPTTPATRDRNVAPAATQPEQPAVPNGFDLGVAQSADHGKYLVDGTGKTVYMLARDSSTTSTCHEGCATEWPPLIARGQPKVMDPSLDDSAVGVIQRKDGSQQVTYGGHPLYHYTQDTAAGQLNGAGKHDEYGDWSLLTPEGTPLAAH